MKFIIFAENSMYKTLIRPLFFLIDPEKAHHLVVLLVRIFTAIPGIKSLLKSLLTVENPSLKTTIAGLTFKNKVGMAAGFDKNADFFNEFASFGFSFIEIGTVTPVAQLGNPKPRLFRLPKDRALINRMGFNNKGVEYAAERLKSNRSGVIIGGNIGKNTVTLNENAETDYLRCFSALYDRVDYFAVNISCPNIKDLDKLQDYASLGRILRSIVNERANKTVYKPVFLKISPDLTFKQLDETLSLYFEVGLDGIIATNTTTDRSCLSTESAFVTRSGAGGLSGLPLKQRSLEIVRYICKHGAGRIPVIGVGGIINAQDAVDMIAAGASLVQVYTGFIYSGPVLVRQCNKAIADYLESVAHKPQNAYV